MDLCTFAYLVLPWFGTFRTYMHHLSKDNQSPVVFPMTRKQEAGCSMAHFPPPNKKKNTPDNTLLYVGYADIFCLKRHFNLRGH